MMVLSPDRRTVRVKERRLYRGITLDSRLLSGAASNLRLLPLSTCANLRTAGRLAFSRSVHRTGRPTPLPDVVHLPRTMLLQRWRITITIDAILRRHRAAAIPPVGQYSIVRLDRVDAEGGILCGDA